MAWLARVRTQSAWAQCSLAGTDSKLAAARKTEPHFMDGTAFGQVLSYGQATATAAATYAQPLLCAGKLVDDQHLFEDLLQVDHLAPKPSAEESMALLDRCAAHMSSLPAASVVPSAHVYQQLHAVPTSPPPAVVPQLLPAECDPLVPRMFNSNSSPSYSYNTSGYHNAPGVNTSCPRHGMVPTPTPTPIPSTNTSVNARGRAIFDFGRNCSSAEPFGNAPAPAPKFPETRLSGMPVEKHRAAPKGASSLTADSQSARPSRTRNVPKRFSGAPRSYAEVDSDDEGLATENEERKSHRKGCKPRRKVAVPREASDAEDDSAADASLDLDPEDERYLRAQLKVLLKDLENSTHETKGLSANDKKKHRNRKASRVSRLKKKLSVFDLTRKYTAIVELSRRQENELETYKTTLNRVVNQLKRHQPLFSCSLVDKPPTAGNARKKARR